MRSVSDTAYAKNQNDQRWYHFDDASVSSISEDGVVVSLSFRLVDTTLSFQLRQLGPSVTSVLQDISFAENAFESDAKFA